MGRAACQLPRPATEMQPKLGRKPSIGGQAADRQGDEMPIHAPWTDAELLKLVKLYNVASHPLTPQKQREAFQDKILHMLREHGCGDADLPELLAQARTVLEREDRERAE